MTFVNDATVLRVIDADTFVMRVDLGWHVSIEGHIRLMGVNAPERNTEEGRVATRYVEDLFITTNHRVVVRTFLRDPDRTFTRYLADVVLSDGRDLAGLLISAGHGKAQPASRGSVSDN